VRRQPFTELSDPGTGVECGIAKRGVFEPTWGEPGDDRVERSRVRGHPSRLIDDGLDLTSRHDDPPGDAFLESSSILAERLAHRLKSGDDVVAILFGRRGHDIEDRPDAMKRGCHVAQVAKVIPRLILGICLFEGPQDDTGSEGFSVHIVVDERGDL
jgi:hypothetical protein